MTEVGPRENRRGNRESLSQRGPGQLLQGQQRTCRGQDVERGSMVAGLFEDGRNLSVCLLLRMSQGRRKLKVQESDREEVTDHLEVG